MNDPRVLEAGVTQEDIEAQEDLALKITTLLSDTKRLSDNIEKKSKSLTSNESKSTKDLEILKDRLVRSKGRYTQVKFINQVNYLMNVAGGADKSPGQDMYTRYEELLKEYAEMNTQYEGIKRTLDDTKKELKLNKKVTNEK